LVRWAMVLAFQGLARPRLHPNIPAGPRLFQVHLVEMIDGSNLLRSNCLVVAFGSPLPTLQVPLVQL
jgi:hypothetical protein